jgi:hypothetical protein
VNLDGIWVEGNVLAGTMDWAFGKIWEVLVIRTRDGQLMLKYKFVSQMW